MTTAMVTGGSGFVGGALIRALRAAGHEVRALARSDRAEHAVRRAGAEPVRGDLDDNASVRAAASGADIIFHSAALVAEWGDRETFFRTNVTGTERVIAAARAAGAKRLVFIGTEAILAGGPAIVGADEHWPAAAKPAGLYPLTKALAEKRVLDANDEDLLTVSVRPRFVWGKGDTSVLPVLVDAVKSKRFAWIEGGHYLTSTCHVRNVCEGALLAAEKGRGGQAYFLTDGNPIEFRRFMTAMLRSAGAPPGDRSVPRWLARALAEAGEALWTKLPLPGGPPVTKMALALMGEEVTVRDDKARYELGYVGAVSIEEGLAEMGARL